MNPRQFYCLRGFIFKLMTLRKIKAFSVVCGVPDRNRTCDVPLRSTTLRCQTQLSEVLLSQVKSRLSSVPNPVRDNPCYSLLLAVHPFLLANLWHLPPFGECSRESSKA